MRAVIELPARSTEDIMGQGFIVHEQSTLRGDHAPIGLVRQLWRVSLA
jgi:hypothetical protein